MMKKNLAVSRIFSVMIIIAAGMLFFSCTDFFSTSLFSWAARDPYSIMPAVTLDNIDDLLQMFEDDPDGSFALLRKIQESADGLTGDELNQLQAAALEAAVNAVGLGQAVLGAASNFNNFEDLDDARDILLKALDNLSNLEETGSILSDMLPRPADFLNPEDDPDFMDFCNASSADDLAMAAVVLLLGEASKNCDGNFDAYLDDPISYMDYPNETRSLAQAMAIVSVLSDRTDELTDGGPLKNMLEHLNLIPIP